MRYFLFFCTVLVLLPKTAFADLRLAVLEFRGNASEAILQQISDEARGGAREGLPRQKYSITSRENIKQILEDMGKTLESCSEECEISLGRDVGADYVLSGGLFVMEGVYILTLKLHDTHSGSLLAQKRIQEKSVITLLEKTNTITRTIAEEEIAGAAAEQSSEKVKVRFESNPSGEGVTVQVGGDLVCTKTPCSEEVPVGQHKVRFQRKEYFAWTEDVVLKAGGTVNAKLKAKFSLLSVDTSPRGLDIFMNGKKESTINKRKLQPATYKIWVKDKCFVDEGMEIKLEAGVDELLAFRPQSKASGVDVEVYDANNDAVPAKIYVDDRYVGDSPYRGEVALCSQKIRVEHEGNSKEVDLTLRENSVSPLQIRIR